MASFYKKYRSYLIVFMGFIGILCLVFRKVIIPGNYLVGNGIKGDGYYYFYPMMDFTLRNLREGHIPLWNPYILGGTPFLGNVENLFFYPLTWLLCFLPSHLFINYFFLIHFILGSCFMYIYLKHHQRDDFSAFFGSAIFMIVASPMLYRIQAGHLTIITTIIWVPLVFLFIERYFINYEKTNLHCLILLLTIQFYAGNWQIFYYAILSYFFSVGYHLIKQFIKNRNVAFVRTTVTHILIVALFVTFLCLPLLLPAYENSQTSHRAEVSMAYSGSFPLFIESFITLLFPRFFGDETRIINYSLSGYLWEFHFCVGFLGVFFFIFFLFQPRKNNYLIFLGGCAAFFLAIGLSAGTPYYAFFYNYIPMLKTFRGHVKVLHMVCFFMAVIAGHSMHFFLLNYREKKYAAYNTRIIAWTVSILVLMSILLAVLKLHGGNFFEAIIFRIQYLTDSQKLSLLAKAPQVVIKDMTVTLIFAGIFLTALWLSMISIISQKGLKLIFFSILCCNAIYLNEIIFKKTNLPSSRLGPSLQSVISYDREPFRILTNHFNPNIGMIDRIQTLNGYENFLDAHFQAYIGFNENRVIPHPFILIKRVTKLLGMLNVKYLYMSGIKHALWVGPAISNHIFKNKSYVERAYIVHKYAIQPDTDEVLSFLASPEFNPAEEVLLNRVPSISIDDEVSASKDSIQIEHYVPEEIIVNTQLKHNGILVLADIYNPGWHVYVDGFKKNILRANHVVRAVALNKGDHVIRFVYEPASFIYGNYICGAAFIGWIIWIVTGRYLGSGKK